MNSLLLLLAVAQSVDVVTVERTAKIIATDTLGEESRIHCTQVLTVAEDRLRIEDTTFGVVTLIRVDLGKIWKFDRFLKVVFEADLKEWNAAHAEELERIRAGRAAVKGTDEEKRLTRLLVAFGAYDGTPEVETRKEEKRRRVVVDGKQTVARMTLDAEQPCGNHYKVLSKAGAFHPAVGKAMAGLKGTPMSGHERYVLLGKSYRVDFDVTSVKSGKAEKDLFAPPNGYARASSPDLKDQDP